MQYMYIYIYIWGERRYANSCFFLSPPFAHFCDIGIDFGSSFSVFLETFIITLSPYLLLRGQGRAQRGRRPLHKIRVCLILGTTFYKQILPKCDVILKFPNNIQNKKKGMCFPVHTIQVYRRPAWWFWVFLAPLAALGVSWIVLFTR